VVRLRQSVFRAPWVGLSWPDSQADRRRPLRPTSDRSRRPGAGRLRVIRRGPWVQATQQCRWTPGSARSAPEPGGLARWCRAEAYERRL